MTSVLLNSLIGVAILMVLATGVLWIYGAPKRWAPALAVLRGVVQLAILSVILTGVITNGYWVALALLVMFGVASVTAIRRIRFTRQTATMVFTAMGVGIAVTLTIVFVTGTIEFSPRYVLAIGGIVIGNSMTIATLAGRRFTELVRDRWDQVEAWMSLGATPRQSTRELARDAVPQIDPCVQSFRSFRLCSASLARISFSDVTPKFLADSSSSGVRCNSSPKVTHDTGSATGSTPSSASSGSASSTWSLGTTNSCAAPSALSMRRS